MSHHYPIHPDPQPDPQPSGVEVDDADAGRIEVESFIAQVYQLRYGARLRSFLPRLIAFRDNANALHAAVGLRGGHDGPLFVEQYLDTSAERTIGEFVGRQVQRDELVEVGNFAAVSAGQSRDVIVDLTFRLHRSGYRWVLFVATRQLRNAFDRLHLATVEIADATPGRVCADPSDWGRYYETQPKLMFGDLAAGYAYLTRTGRFDLAADALAEPSLARVHS